MRGIAPLEEGGVRIRFLNDDECERLLESCQQCGGPSLHAMVTLAISTGARRGELLSLCWSDIDLQKRRITIGDVGGGSRSRTLPLAPQAADTLRPLAKVRRIGGDEVFADRQGVVIFPRRDWETALRVADIEDFRFHDLRHTAAAFLADSGASLAEIADFLGHRSLQGVQRYAHLAVEKKPTGVDQLYRRLFERND